jgi:hypothetical protein
VPYLADDNFIIVGIIVPSSGRQRLHILIELGRHHRHRCAIIQPMISVGIVVPSSRRRQLHHRQHHHAIIQPTTTSSSSPSSCHHQANDHRRHQRASSSTYSCHHPADDDFIRPTTQVEHVVDVCHHQHEEVIF